MVTVEFIGPPFVGKNDLVLSKITNVFLQKLVAPIFVEIIFAPVVPCRIGLTLILPPNTPKLAGS